MKVKNVLANQQPADKNSNKIISVVFFDGINN